MTKTSATEITIVGAGIIGINIGLKLLEAGYSVQIVDANEPATGCSRGNAGIIATYGVTPVSMPGLWKQAPKMLMDPVGPLTIRWQHLFKIAPWLFSFWRAGNREIVESSARALAGLVQHSYRDYQSMAQAYGMPQLIKPSSILAVYESREHFERDAYTWDLRRRHASGVEWAELGQQELRSIEPALAADLRFAIAMEGSGFVVDPLVFTRALFDEFIKQGGRFRQREVKGIQLQQGKAVLITSEGTVPTEKLVIAAGAFSARLSSFLGESVPLEQERGYHITLSDYAGKGPSHAIMSPKHKVIATPMQSGLRIAGMVEFGGFLPPNYARCEVLHQQLQALFPSITAGKRSDWMGHRPTLPDSLPVIDRSRVCHSVFYAFGHQHVGLTSGPMTGRLITEMINGVKPSVDITPFRLQRFLK